MAARSTWKGYLKISLVNIPIRVFPATDAAATISFNQLHAECRTRIQQKRWCPTCEVEVPSTDRNPRLALMRFLMREIPAGFPAQGLLP